MAKSISCESQKTDQVYLCIAGTAYFLSACRLSLGMCWKAGVAAEVIGVPSGSIGEKLYNAKIYLNTPDLFAWTIVIIVISFVFEKCFLGIVSRIVYMIEHR